MIDCGLTQECDLVTLNWAPCLVPESSFDTLLLTHARIDHIGLSRVLRLQILRAD